MKQRGMSKGFFILLAGMALALVGCRTVPVETFWPPLLTGDLSYSTRTSTNSPKFSTETIEIKRDGQRIAQVKKIRRTNNEFTGEFTFSAFVAGQRVFISSRIASTNEGTHFISMGDVQVMTDVRLPNQDLAALIVVSREHQWNEIFIRQPEGDYWPANDPEREAVDANLRKGAEAIAPLLKQLVK